MALSLQCHDFIFGFFPKMGGVQRLAKPDLQDQTAGKSGSETGRRTCPEDFNRGKDFKAEAVLSGNIWGI